MSNNFNHNYMCSMEAKRKESEALELQIKEFENKGGKIKEIPFGVTARNFDEAFEEVFGNEQ